MAFLIHTTMIFMPSALWWCKKLICSEEKQKEEENYDSCFNELFIRSWRSLWSSD